MTGTAAFAQDSPLPTVALDLNAGHIVGSLDFDVPVRITGKVANEVNQVALTVSRLERMPAKPKSGVENPPLCDKPTPIIVSTNSWTRVTGLAGEAFSIVIPALEPNRYYCLTFSIRRNLGADELKQFSPAAEKVIRAAFDPPGTENGLTDTAADQLRRELASTIKSAAKPLVVDFKADTLFDTNVKFEQVRSRFSAAERPRLTGQRNVVLGQGNINRTVLRQQPQFAGWKGLATTDQFFRELQQAALKDENFAKLIEPFQPAMKTVLSWQPADAARLLAGRPDNSAEPPVFDWSGTTIRNRGTAVRATIATLRDARDLVASFINRPGGTPQTNVSQNDLKALLASIDTTIGVLGSVQDELDQIAAAVTERERGVTAFIEFVQVEATASSTLLATTVAEFSTRHAQYVSMDLGLGFVPAFDEAFTYIGLNLYLRPVNKQAPLKGWQFKRRFALMGGMTLTGNLAKQNERFNLLGDRMLVAGAGLRFIDSMRIVGGGMFFHKDDPNPIVTKKEWAWSPFMALSIDWDVRSTWERVTGAKAPQ